MARCLACWQAGDGCWCHEVAPLEHRTKVVILQHPREARNRSGTARMVERGLVGSERLVGVSFEGDPRFRALVTEEAIVLYLTEAARPVTELEPRRGRFTMFVVDGTWWQAAKIWRLNQTLRTLPAYRIAGAGGSRYRIRRGDPSPDGLSTVEAVAAALDAIDGEAGRHAALLAPLDALVRRRIATASSRRRAPRHRPRRGAVRGESALFSGDEGRGTMSRDIIETVRPLGFPWEAFDPFLFCAYHDDRYPAGNEELGPAASLAGRRLGEDFEGKDGWRMYHGLAVPGFPHHPHRGFETVTIVKQGLVDHFDSLGATARYGAGDVQWLTAGRGIEHSEMFPLVDRKGPNPLELFQIWLNLPSAKKLSDPHFAMFWGEDVPKHVARDDRGRVAEITIVAGRLGDTQAPVPPPASWASRPDAHVAIWTLRLEPRARFTLPEVPAGVNRTLYVHRGDSLQVADASVGTMNAVVLRPGREVPLENGTAAAELLFLQGRPIGEPVAAHGPFVMNTPQEIQETLAEYRRTRFGGWSWPADGPAHPRAESRFARHPDGREERPTRGDP